MDQVVEVFESAKRKIEASKWLPRAASTINGEEGWCVGLAMSYTIDFLVSPEEDAKTNGQLRRDTYKTFCDANGLSYKTSSSGLINHEIFEWNDTVCSGETEALASLDKAIAYALPPVPDVSFLDKVEAEVGDRELVPA